MSNVNVKERKKLIWLVVIVVVLVVAIVLVVNSRDKAATGDVNAEETQGQGLVVEDTATVEVDIDEPTTGAAAEE